VRWSVSYVAAAIVLLLVAMACESDEEAPAPPADETPAVATSPTGEAEVEIEDLAFQPAELRVRVGTTVLWKNRDDIPHTATEGQPGDTTGFRSPQLGNREEFSNTFAEAGTFAYYCEVHPTMLGRIIVEP
jgi:plastocyanin